MRGLLSYKECTGHIDGVSLGSLIVRVFVEKTHMDAESMNLKSNAAKCVVFKIGRIERFRAYRALNGCAKHDRICCGLY